MSQANPPTDQRRHARFEIFEYVLVLQNHNPQPIPAVIVDISLGGIQTRSRQAPTLGEICQLTIGQGGKPPIVVSAEVRFVTPIEGGDLCATGYRFIAGDIEERKALVNYIHETFQRQGEVLLS